MRRVWAFVMVLAASRHMFVRPVFGMDQQSWTSAHVGAFEFFGGVPARLVPDNLKAAVDRPDLYDPKINRAYAELAAHYDCLVDPARALKPKDKPRVERPMPYVRDSFWRGRTWENLDQMQDAALVWCVRVAGQRHHRGIDGASPHTLFLAVEADVLRSLPAAPFELAAWSYPKVGSDCHVKVAGALYSVPWRLIGQQVDARATTGRVEVFAGGSLIKTHRRVERGRQTDWADYPPEKVAFFMRTPMWCRKRAGELGVHVTALIAELLEVNALHRLRSAQGVLGLAESTASSGSIGPANGRSRSETRRIALSKAFWWPGPRPPPTKSLTTALTATLPHICTAHKRSSPTRTPSREWRDDPPTSARNDATDVEALRHARNARRARGPGEER
jgi:hypothetical protein